MVRVAHSAAAMDSTRTSRVTSARTQRLLRRQQTVPSLRVLRSRAIAIDQPWTPLRRAPRWRMHLTEMSPSPIWMHLEDWPPAPVIGTASLVDLRQLFKPIYSRTVSIPLESGSDDSDSDY